MSEYNVIMCNDMGHLFIGGDYQLLPQHIKDFVNSKACLYVTHRIEKRGKIHLSLYDLRPGLEKQWTYFCGKDRVNITYEL